MGKINLRFWKWFSKPWMSNFSANILGVIIGIALTFGITFLVQRHSEQQQLNDMMLLIKQEMNNNKTWMRKIAQRYQHDFAAYRVILDAAGWNQIPKDTLEKHITQVRSFPVSYAGSSAWNTFQNTGMVQKLRNANLIAQLSEYYFWIDEMKTAWKEYHKEKEILTDAYEAKFQQHPHEYMKALLNNSETKKFLEEIGVFNYFNFPYLCEEVIIPFTDYVLYQIDNRGNDPVDFETFKKQIKPDL